MAYASDWQLNAALVSCIGFGLMHGFDYDHLAAISDITAVEHSLRRGMRLGMTYALGHAFIVSILGACFIEFQFALPSAVDRWMERVIGLTLIALGTGVAAGILRSRAAGHSHTHVESRLAVAVNGVRWLGWRTRRIWNRSAPQPDRFHWMYTGKSVFMIGILHGIGAETPSQVASILLAARLGGPALGMMGLGAFCLGMLLMNAMMTAALGGAFQMSGHHPRFYRAIAWAGAIYSCLIGVVFLFGLSSRLPQRTATASQYPCAPMQMARISPE